MSQKQVKTIKPFLSVLLVMGLLFGFAFIKMENRRLGYSFMKLAQKEKQLRNQQRQKVIELARMTGPERVQLLATQHLPLKKAGEGQIIQMTEDGIAIIQ
jgi:hypothetical protein